MTSQEEKFFKLVQAQSGYVDIGVVSKVYWGMVRTIVRELAEGKDINLPNFGKFRITEQKARLVTDINTGNQVSVPPTKTVRFSPAEKLKYYMKNK